MNFFQLSRFPELQRRPYQVAPLGGAGGLSGGTIWRVECEDQAYALRLWPAETDLARLRRIHALQRQWREANLKFIPQLYTTIEGDSFVENAAGYWELAEWMPGRAIEPAAITPSRLDAIAAAVATIHQVAAARKTTFDISPGLRQRYAMLERWRDIDRRQLDAAIVRLAWPEFADFAQQTLELFAQGVERIAAELRLALQTPLKLHDCLRDLHREHILLTDDSVSGILDFGAARAESPAGDLARLCGSLFEDDRGGWADFLARYEQAHPLSEAERHAIIQFDRSAVFLTGLQWIEWIALDQRHFSQPKAVLARLNLSLRRMRFLLK
ncbi:MAG: phosphotransferase enzyme family protein [Blastopirellula sp. JB062]